jgi:hypothetical protein
MWKMMVLAAACAILGAFPLAALVALVSAFPIPFSGQLSGPQAVLPSQGAVLTYGLLGGFIVLAIGGAGTGLVATRVSGPDRERAVWLCVPLALAFSAACVLFLTTLDLFIGPW